MGVNGGGVVDLMATGIKCRRSLVLVLMLMLVLGAGAGPV
jgi:hypothetical protein